MCATERGVESPTPSPGLRLRLNNALDRGVRSDALYHPVAAFARGDLEMIPVPTAARFVQLLPIEDASTEPTGSQLDDIDSHQAIEPLPGNQLLSCRDQIVSDLINRGVPRALFPHWLSVHCSPSAGTPRSDA